VIEVEDDKDQILTNSKVQASGSYDQNQVNSSSQVQDHQQVASTSSQPNVQSSASSSTNQHYKRPSPRFHNW
jgi:hypothetical protein